MKNQDTDILLKARSGRSILAAAYRLYNATFFRMVKSCWLFFLLPAVVLAATGLLLAYDFYFLIPLAIAALVLELLLWLMVTRQVAQRPLRSIFRSIRRHWLLLTGIAIGGWIALLPVCLLVCLPLIILVFAQWESSTSTLFGDPSGMPSYMPYLMVASWFITTLLQLAVRLFIIYAGYYAWGSAEARKREREQQKLNIQL
jgi:hypothetical protein